MPTVNRDPSSLFMLMVLGKPRDPGVSLMSA
jgi:hypothetical protein